MILLASSALAFALVTGAVWTAFFVMFTRVQREFEEAERERRRGSLL